MNFIERFLSWFGAPSVSSEMDGWRKCRTDMKKLKWAGPSRSRPWEQGTTRWVRT